MRALVAKLAVAAGLLLAAMTSLAVAGPSIAIDLATGKVLSQDNASERWYPASTTKLMTAYIVMSDISAGRASLDTPVVMSRLAAGQAPGKMGYPAGSVMRLDKALQMLLVKSANDVAVAIGETLAGSHEAFVARMNREATRLGLADTQFVNPNGLPGPGQHTTARDLAMLARVIKQEFPSFNSYFGIEAIRAGDVQMVNGNGLLGRYRGADGMKTGYICASGFNLVSSATRDGRTVIVVVLGADGPISRERESARLLEQGFEADLASISLTVEQLPVSNGPPTDVSGQICSDAARTARANERQVEEGRAQTYGSPYMTERDREPVAINVALGGAAASGDIAAGITHIEGYGIPRPTPRPVLPGEAVAVQDDRAASVVPQ